MPAPLPRAGTRVPPAASSAARAENAASAARPDRPAARGRRTTRQPGRPSAPPGHLPVRRRSPPGLRPGRPSPRPRPAVASCRNPAALHEQDGTAALPRGGQPLADDGELPVAPSQRGSYHRRTCKLPDTATLGRSVPGVTSRCAAAPRPNPGIDGTSGSRANAAFKDPDRLRGVVSVAMVLSRAADVTARPGLLGKVIALGAGWRDEPVPAPSRAELLSIIVGD